jgi:hypothetical protein
MSKPLHRREGLVVEPLGDEVLVFDQEAQRAHSLNATAVAVWAACDGTRGPDELAQHCGLARDAVDLALDSLAGCDLLVDRNPSASRVSRRAVLRRAALAGAGIGVALPVIRSITAPSVAAAQSGCSGNGESCGSRGGNPPCCVGSTCRGSQGVCDTGGCVDFYRPCNSHGDCCYPYFCATSSKGTFVCQ